MILTTTLLSWLQFSTMCQWTLGAAAILRPTTLMCRPHTPSASTLYRVPFSPPAWKKLQDGIGELDNFHVFQIEAGLRPPTSLITLQLVSLDFSSENISNTRQTAAYREWVKGISFYRKCGAASVGERYTKIWFINRVDNVNWPPCRDWKADVSSVSPSSERIDELWVV